MKKIINTLIGFTIAGAAQAATISWNSANLTSLTGTEVSTNGTFVQALNFGGGTSSTDWDTTINGVAFTGLASGGTNNVFDNPASGNFSANSNRVIPSSNDAYTTGLAVYDTLLSGFLFDSSATDFRTVTLSGLTTGQEYLVQLFLGDDRSTVGSKAIIIDQGTGNEYRSFTYTLDANDANGIVINGTFTADAATQAFTMNNVNTSTEALTGLQLNAYQLRAIPEPTAVTLMGLGVVPLLLRRRRNRAS